MIHTKQDNKPEKAYTCIECDSTDVKEIRRWKSSKPGHYGVWITTKCGNCNNIVRYHA